MANATSTQLQQLYVAYFGRAADPTGLDYWTEKGITQAGFAANMYAQAEFKDEYGSKSVEAQVNQIYKNLFDREADVTGLTYWTQQINLGTLKVAEIATHLIWAAENNSGSSDDKSALSNRTNAAVAYTAEVKETTAGILAYQPLTSDPFSAGKNINEAKTYLEGIDGSTAHTSAGITASVDKILANGVPAAAKTYDLTSSIDTLTGGSGADIFNGGTSDGGTQTIQTLDSIDGGGATDTLSATLSATGTYTPTLTSVEVLKLSNTAASTLDLTAGSSVNDVQVVSASANLTVSNIASETVPVSVSNVSTGSITITLDVLNSAVNTSGVVDETTLTVSSNTTGTIAIDTAIEDLNIVSSGSDNTLTAITTGANRIDISGATDLTVTGAWTTAETISSTATGDVTITSNNSNATTITTAGGADDVTITGGSAVTETVTLGAGNDTLTFTASLDDVDVIDGGAGTDTLEGINADINALTSATTTSNVSNFEAVTITDEFNAGSGFDISDVQEDGIATLNLVAAATATTNVTNNAESITGEAGAFTINLGTTFAGNVSDIAAGTLTIVDVGTATTDSLTLNNKGVNSTTGNAVATFHDQAVTSTGYETVTIDTGDKGNANVAQTITTLTITPDNLATDVVKLVVTGGNTFDVSTSLTTTSTGLTTVDASGMTAQAAGTTTFDLDLISLGALGTFKAIGSSGDDVFGVLGTSTLGNFASTIESGAGADTISTGSGNDTITAGAGNDSVESGSGNDTVTLGAGDDTITISATGNLTSADTFTGGDGTDTVKFTGAVADAASTFSRFTGFEVFHAAPAAADTFTLSNFTNSTFTRIDFGDAGDSGNAITVNNVGDEVTVARILAGVAADTASIDRLIDDDDNSLEINLRGGGITVTAITANDEESITISSNASTDDTTITTLTASDLTSLTIKDDANVIITNNITATKLATVDASASTGTVDVDAGNSTVDITATAGTGIFKMEGGSGDDTITGGTLADIIVGGSGTDTITGGAGADVITGGAGADIINGGTGADTFTYTASSIAASHNTTGGDNLDFATAQTDVISIDIATSAANATVVETTAITTNSMNNATVYVLTGGSAINVSGNNAQDIAAIIAGFTIAAAHVDNNAEAITIINADTDGDGSADEVQAWWVHDTASTSTGTISEAAEIGSISTIAASADLASDFTAAMFAFA